MSSSSPDRDPRKASVRRLGRYVIIREIARGGGGVVYEGIDPGLARRVALKVLRHGASDDHAARLKREASLAGQLKHPGIIGIHEIGVETDERGGEDVLYIAMDFVPGSSLEQAFPEMDLATRVELLRQVADAVGYAHERDIVHRDLKPANVLIDAEGRAIVTDFGLARSLHDSTALTQTGDIIGTAHYMAPEQVRGESKVAGPRTDVWGLGAMLYRLLTEQLPFPGSTSAEVYDRISKAPPAAMPAEAKVPPELEAICLVALEKDPARRYPDARALAADLARWQRGEAPGAKPASRLYRLAERLLGNPLAVVAIGLPLALGAAALAFTIASTSRAEAAKAFSEQLATGCRERFGRMIDPALATLRQLRRQLATGEQINRAPFRSPAKGDDPLAQLLADHLADNPAFGWVSFSTPDDDFVGAYRRPGQPNLHLLKSYTDRDDADPRLETLGFNYIQQPAGWRPIPYYWTQPTRYQPTARPFYEAAIGSTDIVILEPYVFEQSYPGLTAAVAVRAEQQLRGVLTVDFEVWQVSEALRELSDARGQRVLLLTPAGKVVATSGQVEGPAALTQDGQLIDAEAFNDPQLAETVRQLRAAGDQPLAREAQVSLTNHRATVIPLEAQGLDLAMVVLLPDAAADTSLAGWARLLAWLALAIATLLAALGVVVAQRLLTAGPKPPPPSGQAPPTATRGSQTSQG